MAEIIARVSQGSRRYPWQQWLDGKSRLAKYGKDFTCTISGFRSTLYQRAKKEGRVLELTERGDSIEFRFLKRGAKRTK